MAGIIAYYSLSGSTRELCGRLSKAAGYALTDIKETKKRGIFSAFMSIPGAARGRASQIEDITRHLKSAGVICLAGPIWAGGLTPAMNAALKSPALKGKRVAGILTCSGGPGRAAETFKARAEESGAVVEGVNVVNMKKLAEDNSVTRLSEWLKQLAR